MELKNSQYEVDAKGVAIIWLNRPQRMNAWTGRLHTEYRYLLKRANDDDKVRAIVVTGRGKGFCVGGTAKRSVAMRIALTIRGKATLPNPLRNRCEFRCVLCLPLRPEQARDCRHKWPRCRCWVGAGRFADLRFAVPVKFTTAHGKLNLPANTGWRDAAKNCRAGSC